MKTYVTKKSVIIGIIIFAVFQIQAISAEFRVKIYEPKTKISAQSLSEFYPLRIQNNFTEVGYYDNYLKAMKAQNMLEEIGFSSTEIVAYIHNAPISLEDAFALNENLNEYDEFIHTRPLSENEITAALDKVRNTDFYYTIFIGVHTEKDVNLFYELPKNYGEYITVNGKERYAYGKFSSFQNTYDLLKMIQEQGFEDAEIVAFDSLERIPVTAAIKKEKLALEQTLAQIKK